MSHIGINAHLLSRSAGYRRAGIHVYIAETLRQLPVDTAAQATVYTADPPAFVPRLPLRAVRRSLWPTENPLLRIAWEQAAWPLRARIDRLDLLHNTGFVSPILTSRPTMITIYDLSFIHYPARFPPFQRWYLTTQTRRSAQAAVHIITISQATKEDIHRHFQVPPDRITVAAPGVDAGYRPLPAAEIAAFRRRMGLPDKFVLHVGTLQPRKNITTLIDALGAIKRPDLHLCLVGGKGWLYDEIFAQVGELGLRDRVHFMGYAADDDLPLWYNTADLLAFPSVYEGFGMPVVEAMACGTPVVAADVSAIPEAAGDAALLFDPHDAAQLAEQMTRVLDNPAQAAKMRAAGPHQAGRFSWQQTGTAVAAAYQKAFSSCA